MMNNGEAISQIATIYSGRFNRRRCAELPIDDEQLAILQYHLPPTRDARLLDAGCGNGQFGRAVLRSGYRNVWSIDLFEQLEDAPNYVCASVAETPFEDESFDLIYSLSVIFHLDDPTDAIKEFERLLRPGGKVLITCHTRYSLFTLVRVVKRWLGLKSSAHLQHVQFLSAATYRSMLQEAGLSVIEVDGFRVSMIGHFFQRVRRRYGWTVAARPHTKRSGWIGWFRATVGYHAVLVAEKVKGA